MKCGLDHCQAWLFPLALLGWAAALGGCVGGPGRDPLLVQDLSDYAQKMVEWEGVESRVLRAIGKVERNQFVDDDYVASTLASVVGEARLHLEHAARYKPKTRAIERIHNRYLKSWRDLAEAFDTIIRSMEARDYLELSGGVERMRRARQELIEVAAALSDLLDTTGVSPPPSRRKEKVKFRKSKRPLAAAPQAAEAQPEPGGSPSSSSSPQ